MNTLSENTYVNKAEQVIKTLQSRKNDRNGRTIPMVATSKIRNLLAMTSDIYNDVINNEEENLSSECRERIEYLYIRFIYEIGRDDKQYGGVKDFAETADILKIIKEIEGSRKNYIMFNRYMEALVAFHRYYGGKDL